MSIGWGETCSVACALIWAIVTISLKKVGERVPPFELNLYKNIGMALLLVPAILLFEAQAWGEFKTEEVGILLFSGVVGVCLADWFLLASINLLGAGRNAILDCLYSPFVMLMAWKYLGEDLETKRLAGASLVVIGIIVATTSGRGEVKKGNLAKGVSFGIVAMFAMAVAIVAAKPIMERAPIFITMEIRMLAGVTAGIIGLGAVGKLGIFVKTSTAASFPHLKIWTGICLPAFFAMCLWVEGYRLIDASLASILNQTSTFFILGFAAIFLGEKLTKEKIFGSLLAFGGVTLIVAL